MTSPQYSEEPARPRHKASHAIPLDARKVSRYSTSPHPDYDLVDEVGGRRSDAVPLVPPEDYRDDESLILPAITVPRPPIEPVVVPQRGPITVIRPAVIMDDHPPADYDLIDEPTLGSRDTSRSADFSTQL